MATMLMMKQMTNTMLRFNKLAKVSKAQSFPHQLKLHSCSLSFPTHYVSRVSFTSASRIYQSRYPSEDSVGDDDAKAAHRIREAQQVYEDDDHAEKVVDDIKQKAKDTARRINEKAKEGTHQASDAMHEGKERAKEGANRAGESMHEAKERAKEGAHRAGESMHEAKERTKDSMRWTADKTKEGAGKAAEAVQNIGEKAKETAKGAWETAKDATQKIKEKVVGEDDEDKHARPEDYMEDHLPKRPFDAGSKDRNMHRSGP